MREQIIEVVEPYISALRKRTSLRCTASTREGGRFGANCSLIVHARRHGWLGVQQVSRDEGRTQDSSGLRGAAE